MKRISLYLVLAAVALQGCSTQKNFYLNPALRTFSRETLEEAAEIKLPPNWNVENFKKIALGVHVTMDGQEIDRSLNARLQTELSKLKRFRVYSAYNVAGHLMFLDLADIGEAEIKEAEKQPTLNYVLNAKLSVACDDSRVDQSDGRRGYRKYFRFEVTCDWNLEDLGKQEVALSGVEKGITERLQFLTTGGHRCAGYVESQDEEAICSATMKALSVVANKIGNLRPVGGTVTAVSRSGERLTLDKGFFDGIGKYHQVAVFVRLGKNGKVAIPVALAEAMPGAKESNLHVYRWNDANEDAEMVVKEYRANPRGYAKSHKLYAVAYGMPMPPEWEQDQTEKDEKIRLGMK